MSKGVPRNLLCLLLAFGCLICVAGCDTTAGPAVAFDSSALTTDLASFVQQFAREAFAAFLL